MKLPDRPFFTPYHRLFALRRLGLLLLGMAAGALTTEAQPVFSADPIEPAIPDAIAGSLPTSNTANATTPSSASTPIHWGNVTVRPRIYYQFMRSEGILARPGLPSTTTIQSISPGVQINFGTHWILDYSPTQTYYTNPDFDDFLSQTVSLTGGTNYGNWQFGVSQTYGTSSQTLIQTGQQTDQKSYNSSLTASYRFGEHMSLDTILNQQVQLIDNSQGQAAASVSPSTRNWFVEERLNYRFTSRLNTNLGLDIGYTAVTPGPDITFTRPRAQIIWQPTDKISLDVQAGFENRKFRSGPAPDQTTPNYSGVISYRPFENTKFSFYLVREVPVSYLVGQTTDYSRWNIVLDQRLLQHLYLHTGYAEEDSDYSRDATGLATRRDKSYLYNARLSATVFKRVMITALYQHRKLNSSDPNFSFNSNSVGFEITYRY